VAAAGVAAAGKLMEYLHEIEEKTMKKRILPVTILWEVLFTSFVFAACEKPPSRAAYESTSDALR